MRRPTRAALSVAVLATCTVIAAGTVAAQPPDSVPDVSTASDGSDASDATLASGSMMPMSDAVESAARRAWLDFAGDADADTFAGGADARDLVEGNRVIAIGDSLMASTARRYGGELCRAVVPDGWDLEVDAETGRFIDFGERVLDRRLDDDFDAAVVMLGNNYGADPDVFRDGLEEIVDDLAPRPTILYTVSMFEPNRADVNDIIYDVAMQHDNVRVIDWQGETAKDPTLLGGDGLHLSDAGRARFAELLADELGRAPGDHDSEGDCLSSDFTDDSATSGTGTTLPGQAPAPPPMTTAPPSNGGGSDTTAAPPPPPPASDGGGGGGGDTTPPGGGETTAPTPPPTQVTTPPTQATTPPTQATTPATTAAPQPTTAAVAAPGPTTPA